MYVLTKNTIILFHLKYPHRSSHSNVLGSHINPWKTGQRLPTSCVATLISMSVSDTTALSSIRTTQKPQLPASVRYCGAGCLQGKFSMLHWSILSVKPIGNHIQCGRIAKFAQKPVIPLSCYWITLCGEPFCVQCSILMQDFIILLIVSMEICSYV